MNHIYAQRTPLQMSHEASSIRDLIRANGGASSWSSWTAWGETPRDVLNLVHELEEKGASLRVLEPAIDTGGPMAERALGQLASVCSRSPNLLPSRRSPSFH